MKSFYIPVIVWLIAIVMTSYVSGWLLALAMVVAIATAIDAAAQVGHKLRKT
jgi:hypothetical protein